MSYQGVAQVALERWLDAERRKDRWPVDSDEWQAAYLEGNLAKAEYQEATDDIRRPQLVAATVRRSFAARVTQLRWSPRSRTWSEATWPPYSPVGGPRL